MSLSPDPYAPPGTLVADAEDGSAAARRPLLVWVIAIYFSLTGVALLGAVVAVWQRLLPLDAEAQHYMDHHAIAAYVLSLTMVVLYLCAARSLFLLRVRAPHLLLACVVVNVVDTVIDWAVGYTATLTVGSFITGLLIPAVVYAYAYHLRRKGMLR